MKSEFCAFENAVSAAVSNGQWSEELREHVDNCSQCADIRLVCQYLTSTTPAAEADVPLPAAGFVWWRGLLAERQEQAKRAVAAIEIMQKFALVAALIAVIGFTLLWRPVDWSVLLLGSGLLLSTAVILYSWIRGRI